MTSEASSVTLVLVVEPQLHRLLLLEGLLLLVLLLVSRLRLVNHSRSSLLILTPDSTVWWVLAASGLDFYPWKSTDFEVPEDLLSPHSLESS